jgi:hypothetical protein
MRRAAALAVAAALLCGCGATATQNWRSAPDLAAPAWAIKGTQGAWGHVVVTINGEPALDGKVSIFTGSGALAGAYQGKAITGDCHKGRGAQVRTQCAISMDGRKITTLYFRVK